MPDAEEYSFSFCNTSESSLDLELLKYVDEIITEYEGSLFLKSTSKKILEILYKRLPPELQEKYSYKDSIINKFNDLLKTEKLWMILPYDNEYLNSVIDKKNELSLSKKVMANRLILGLNNSDLDIFASTKYYSMWFMTNGTNVTDEYIKFLKSIFKNEITVSIDGPKFVHDTGRVFSNGEGSFDKTIQGIRKFQNNNISVIASVTLTPHNLDYYEIVNFLSSIGVKSINSNLSRGNGKNVSFDEKSIMKLIDSYKRLYEKIYSEVKSENYEFLPLLKNDFMFAPIKCIYNRRYKISRCNFGNEIVVSSRGELFHCNSIIGNKRDLIGNINSKISYKKVKNVKVDVRENADCKYCFSKYLCGGTCYANDYLNAYENKRMECLFRKEIIKLSIYYYIIYQQGGLLDLLLQKIN